MNITVNSLSALAQVWNTKYPSDKVKEPKPRIEKARKCRKCGAKMEHILGTNIWVCNGIIEVPAPTEKDPNAKEKRPCRNFILDK